MATAEEVMKKAENESEILKRWLTGPDADAAIKIMQEQFADRTSYVAGDPYATTFQEGQRNVVLFMLDVRESDL